MEVVVKSTMDPKVKTALTSLCKLYAVHGIVENLGGFIQVFQVHCQSSNGFNSRKKMEMVYFLLITCTIACKMFSMYYVISLIKINI